MSTEKLGKWPPERECLLGRVGDGDECHVAGTEDMRGEGWSQRGWSPCPALGGLTPGTFPLGPWGEGGRSRQEAEEKPGSPGNTGHKWVRRESGDKGGGRQRAETCYQKCGAAGRLHGRQV